MAASEGGSCIEISLKNFKAFNCCVQASKNDKDWKSCLILCVGQERHHSRIGIRDDRNETSDDQSC